jgi:threonine synthase
VRVIAETDGVVAAVDDEELLAAKAAVDASGVGCEPASAASVAGVRRLAREGVIRPGETAVALLTGHVLKDPGVLLDVHRAAAAADHGGPARPWANPPVEIDATADALERAVAGAAG